MSTLFAFFHHVAAFTLVSAVAIELVLIRQDLTNPTVRRLLVTDAVLGAGATILLVVGLLRVFYFEKGPDYYFSSHAFMTKFAVFLALAALAALSVIPTLEFRAWGKAMRASQAPTVSAKKLRIVRSITHGEMIGIVIIVLCAAIMARGGWV